MDDARILTAGPPQPRTGFYFGWRIVLAMFLATMMIYGNTLFGFIILTDPLAREFGWSSAATGSLVSAMWLIAPLALAIAPAIHRFGAFTILIGGLLLQVVCLALVGSIDSFWPANRLTATALCCLAAWNLGCNSKRKNEYHESRYSGADAIQYLYCSGFAGWTYCQPRT